MLYSIAKVENCIGKVRSGIVKYRYCKVENCIGKVRSRIVSIGIVKSSYA